MVFLVHQFTRIWHGNSSDIGRTQNTCSIFSEPHSNLHPPVPIGEGLYARDLNETTPYYDELISMLKVARNRPSIPEYPQVADNIRQAIEQIYNGTEEPKQALDDAATSTSAKVLGW